MHHLMSLLNDEYRAHIDRLLAEHPRDEAMSLAVGGSWEAIAAVEEGVLRVAGYRPDRDLLDIGCGSGRLAHRLAARGHTGRYLGTDVVPALLDYAGELVPSFEFASTDGLEVPAGDDEFDLVSCFSVFTHLPFEACFVLLGETRRVLRPGGRMVVSFLEFAVPLHWPIFEASVASIAVARHHNQFVHRDDLAFLAERAGLRLVRVTDGDDHCIAIDGEYVRDSGEVITSPTRLGQSWMVLEKP